MKARQEVLHVSTPPPLVSPSEATALKSRLEMVEQLANTLITEIQALSSFKQTEARQSVNYYDELRAYEISLIQRALQLSGGRQNQAAKLLGLRATTLNQIIKRYRIE